MTFDPNDRQQGRPRNPGGDNRQRRGYTPRKDARPNGPIQGEVIPPRPGEPVYTYEAVPAEPSLLRNPYLLAGFAVALAIFLAVVVVVFFGGEGDGGGSPPPDSNVVIDPLTPQPGSGTQMRSIAMATVRDGPGQEFAAIGPLRAGLDVSVIGRNADSTWFEILFPQSTLPGWVPSSALQVQGVNMASIPVVASTPIPRPTVVLPSPTPGPTQTQTPTPTITGTATPTGGPDLRASAVPGTCALGRRLVINVTNGGPQTLTSRAISVLVVSIDGQQRALATQTATLAPGESVDIDTTYVVQERVLAVIDPLGALGDANVNNNRVDCIVTGVPVQPTLPAVTATPTPRVSVPPAVAPTTAAP